MKKIWTKCKRHLEEWHLANHRGVALPEEGRLVHRQWQRQDEGLVPPECGVKGNVNSYSCCSAPWHLAM